MAFKSDPVPQQIGFVERYADNSGVEFAVYWDADKALKEITIVSGSDSVEIPRDRFTWLLDRLMTIASEVKA